MNIFSLSVAFITFLFQFPFSPRTPSSTSLVDEYPPTMPSSEKHLPSFDEDAIDGELFFDLVATPTSAGGITPAIRPVKSAQLEVGGKGLPGGGIWKVSDRPRSGKCLRGVFVSRL